jgi:threonine dehydrogenase-like Zn-dependent dehydrogenase
VKALRQTATGPALHELDPPRRAAGEALVRVRTAGICSTDLELARGYMAFSGTLGHEFVGEVVESDHPAWHGVRVAGEINLSCGRCRTCERGLGRHCPARSVLGILGKDGCFAEYLTLPERNLHRIPAHVPDRLACFVEPIAACHEILAQVRIAPADRVVVLGDGKLGQLIAAVLSAQGLSPILAGKHERKLELARARGTQAEAPERLPAKDFDVVIEATGSPSGMQRAIELVRPRGTLVLKSTYHGELRLDAAPLVIDEISLIGSRCGPFQPAIETIARGFTAPDSLIDAVFPLKEAEAAFAHAAAPGVLKVLLEMQ